MYLQFPLQNKNYASRRKHLREKLRKLTTLHEQAPDVVHWAQSKLFYADFLATEAERTENPTLALEALVEFESLFKNLDRAGDKIAWASFHKKYGRALGIAGTLTRGSTYLELAIQSYNRLMTVWTKQSRPQSWADTQMEIAALYGNAGEWQKALPPLERVLEIYTPLAGGRKCLIAMSMQILCLLQIGDNVSMSHARAIAMEVAEFKLRGKSPAARNVKAAALNFTALMFLANSKHDDELLHAATNAMDKSLALNRSRLQSEQAIEYDILRGMIDIMYGLLELDRALVNTGLLKVETARDIALKKNKTVLVRIAEMQIASFRLLESNFGDFSLRSLGQARAAIDNAKTASSNTAYLPPEFEGLFSKMFRARIDGISGTDHYKGNDKLDEFSLSKIEDLEKAGFEFDASFFLRIARKLISNGKYHNAIVVIDAGLERLVGATDLSVAEITDALPLTKSLPYIELIIELGTAKKSPDILQSAVEASATLTTRLTKQRSPILVAAMGQINVVTALEGLYLLNNTPQTLEQIVEALEQVLSYEYPDGAERVKNELRIDLGKRLLRLLNIRGIGTDPGLEAKTIDTLESCLKSLAEEHSTFESIADRMMAIHTATEFGDALAYLYVAHGDPDKALQALDRSRAIWLTTVLRESKEEVTIPAANLKHSRTAWKQKTKDVENFVAGNFMDFNTLFENKIEALVEQAKFAHGKYRDVAARAFGYLDQDDSRVVKYLRATLPDKNVLLAIAISDFGGVALIVRPGKENIDIAMLPNLTRTWLSSMLGDENGIKAVRHLLADAASARSGNTDKATASIGHANRVLEATCLSIWNTVFAPIFEGVLELEELEAIHIYAPGSLTLLPLHAALREPKNTEAGRYLLQDVSVSLWPSLQPLATPIKEVSTSTLIVTDPTGDLSLDTRRLEKEATCLILGKDRRSTVSDVQAQLDGHARLIFYCHGRWHATTPPENGIILADGVLTLHHVAEQNLEVTETVMLAACDSGLIETSRTPNEFLGLPAGFLEAGANTVVSSLWPVTETVSRQIIAAIVSTEPGTAQTDAKNIRSLQIAMIGKRGAALDEKEARGKPDTDYGKWVERTPAAPIHWAAYSVTTGNRFTAR